MLTARIIPCLDCSDGVVVKGVRFSNLRSLGSPALLAERYERDGADELVVLDISATIEGRKNRVSIVRELRSVLSIPLTAGGGVRSITDCESLLEAGADKISINSAAVQEPDIITAVAERFGSQCAVVAIDAMAWDDHWIIATGSGNKRHDRSAIDWAREAVERGAGEILLTSWDKDGTRSGYDTTLIEAITAAVSVPVIASGGAAAPADFVAAYNAGASGLLAASIFHDGEYTISNLKHSLSKQGLPIRL